MKIIVAKNIGFCSGVKRAIQIAEKSLEQDEKPVQFLGNLVHNEEVIEKFRKLGVKFIKNLNKSTGGTVIIQAHGIAPLRKLKLKASLRDATCPLVKKVQLLAQELEKNRFQVIIIGDKKHSETKGIRGYTPKSIIVENAEQAKKLPRFDKIGVVVQTTQSQKNVREILKTLKKRTGKLKFIDTLCPEARKRQNEARKIAKKSDALLVIGSKTSANTKRLEEIAKEVKERVWLMNNHKGLRKKDFGVVKTLGLISGASTPDWEIEKIIKCLQKQ